MTISNFVDSKAISLKELEENLQELRRFTVDTRALQEVECKNCKDKNNQHRLPSEPWTACVHCVACDCLVLTVHGDPMGGGYWDSIIVFKDKA